MVEWIKRSVLRLRLANTTVSYGVIEPKTTTDATPVVWAESELVVDTSTAGSATVRYTINGRETSGAALYAITVEGSYVWPAGGPVSRASTAQGQGVSSSNSYAFPRPSHTFDAANVRLTITGKASTTIKWSGKYKLLLERN